MVQTLLGALDSSNLLSFSSQVSVDDIYKMFIFRFAGMYDLFPVGTYDPHLACDKSIFLYAHHSNNALQFYFVNVTVVRRYFKLLIMVM